ncbi:MAG: multidrug efflux RND transporter permease subunit [Deltaproteobacteria bacterium]|nr:multidrug efflux RND transporter permease subunit [Deltaproteobacteria bacterium]
MSFSETFIRNSAGTTLLTAAIALAGVVAFRLLPVSPLPQVDFPTIQVSASLPGASPQVMASAVAAPLERQFGHIAALTEMTSTSSLGTTTVTLQFELNRNIDAAARDVEAAINAARGQLPSNLPSNPTYRKINPADAPIAIIALTSDTVDRGQMYDAASSILAQKLSQIQGVGQVFVGGGALPAVRVELNPMQLHAYGISLEQVRTVLQAANANQPKGQFTGPDQSVAIGTTDQLFKAAEYRPLVVGFHLGAPVRLQDVAEVEDSVQDVRNAGIADGKPAILLVVSRQPGANIIDTVDRVRAAMPQLQASISPAIKLALVLDQTVTIRASVRDIEITLFISIVLVVMVVYFFLRSIRATAIPGIAVPLSLIGTLGVMYLLGYSLDNLSLMALTISTGFVVDDAIVVLENISRYLEQGYSPLQAAVRGAQGIAFTVVSISISLVAVFIPIMLMGGIVGRLFREFGVTLAVAILVSMVVSLTTTPMMCSKLLRPLRTDKANSGQDGRLAGRVENRLFERLLRGYDRSLSWVLHHPRTVLTAALLTVALSIYLFSVIPKGFFPQQDNGRLMGALIADQDTSFQAMNRLLTEYVNRIKADPAVEHVVGFAGGNGGATNTARMFIALKPLGQRKLSADLVIARLRKKLAHIAGAMLYLQASQDVRVGGRMSNAQYQYTLQSTDLIELDRWAPRLLQALRRLPQLTEVSSDQQNNGPDAYLEIDRATASRLGVTPQLIDNTLYDAFGQQLVSTMYTPLNQYYVVMEAAPQFWQNPDTLKLIHVAAPSGQQVPLSSVTRYEATTTPISVNHQGQFPAVTISFNLSPGVPLSNAVAAIQQAELKLGLPADIHGSFQGTARAYQASLANETTLIIAALASVYIVLGILYESYIHPITILSTLPSAGVGALLGLMATGTELTVIALIGIILLIGIVKKNAILMIDFALEAERTEHKNSLDAIYEACLLRFRPIMMTTMAALFGGLPLAIGIGMGSELRRPLGIAIVGGLIASQILTLYTTPIIYLYLDSIRLWSERARTHLRASLGPRPRDASAEF